MPQNNSAITPPGFVSLFVTRPILALVLSLLIVIAGVAAFNYVEVRELPNVDQPVISVQATYQGASPATIDAEVTSVLEDALSQLEGLEKISSTSSYGRSAITLELTDDADLSSASNEARELVSAAARDLPDDLEDPVIRKNDADADPILRLALTGDISHADLTTLAEGPVADSLTSVEGVAEVEVRGGLEKIIRVTFYPLRLASRGLSVVDLRNALSQANLDVPLGALETSTQSLVVRSVASATSAEKIAKLRINASTLVGDVAFVQLTGDDAETLSRINGQPAVVLNIIRQSVGNTLAISRQIRQEISAIQARLPAGVSISIASDDGVFIEESLIGVSSSILLAVGIVILVIFVFLRSAKAVAIPTVTVPIALVGAVSAIWLAGFSVNTITLLGLVLATGMVVDDAIVVLENIVRKRQEGLGRYAAAAVGAREVLFPVITTTATLAAVFIPISFMPGPAGGIFKEFGFVLAFSVVISSFVALTLCPALCAMLDPGKPSANKPLPGTAEPEALSGLAAFTDRLIGLTLKWRWLLVAVAVGFAAVAFQLYKSLPSEITPREDRGVFFVSLRTPASASLEYTSAQASLVERALDPLVATGNIDAVQSIIGRQSAKNQAVVIVRLTPWADRDQSQGELMAALREPLSNIPGSIISLRMTNSLGIRGAGSGLKFAVTGKNYDRLADLTSALVDRMKQDTTFVNPQLSYDASQPQLELDVNRELAANLGVSPDVLLETIYTHIESDEVAELFINNESVPIKLAVGGRRVDDQTDLENVFVSTESGRFVPASTMVSLTEKASVATLSREGRQPAVAAQANLGEGVDLGAAARRLQELAPEVLGDEGRIVFLGEAATLDESAYGTLVVFAAAILIVFLVLSAQFESFASAFIIVLTVPFGLGAALYAIQISGGSLNYYSQIGLVMLVGIMAKNGILIVEFANQLRAQGASVDRAIRDAMRIRLRPVMMTMVSTVCGGIPLLVASGAGAEARIAVGWVVVGGLGFATVFTLFLTPALYRIIAPLSKPAGAAENSLYKELSASAANQV